MAKRDPQPAPRSRQRGKPVQVQAKKPVGFIVGVVVMALLLVGVVGYAAANQGSGFESALHRADSSFDGLTVSKSSTLSRNHVPGVVKYPGSPPDGGDHNATPQVCRVYDAPVPNENAVHSLEHGAVWITYRPDLPKAQVATLRGMADGQAYVLMSPLTEQQAPVEVSAWGRQLSATSASDEQVEKFVETYANGPQSPEKGATCAVGNTSTGSVPASAPRAQASVTVPQPSASPAG